MPHLEELPTAKSATVAPGWAYVPDTGYDPSKAAINPSHPQKRLARNLPSLATAPGNELTARQQTAIQRHLAELDKDSSKDVHIPVPTRKEASRGSRGKMTPGVKRILQSQKTFANHLADEEALLAMQPPKSTTTASAAPRPSVARPARPPSEKARPGRPPSAAKRAKRDSIASSQQSSSPVPASPSITAPSPTASIGPPAPQASAAAASGEPMDVDSAEAGALHPLLQTQVPAAPSQQERDALVAQPPLSYSAARVGPPPANAPPKRHFCEICGYWGRVKCMKCGARVCGLACKSAHDDSRCLKFYA
ncbi:MAG: hypothetical protein M1821_004280 [Bathelium mastoideum]|nr:MAG: hypothetical protein M1821_004280 [Bathelium mastoideum]